MSEETAVNVAESKAKADKGANQAHQAATLAKNLLSRTRQTIAWDALKNTRKPRAALSETGFQLEENRAATAEATPLSPLITISSKRFRWGAVFSNVEPGTHEDNDFQSLKVRAVSCKGQCLGIDRIYSLSKILSDPGCIIGFLDLSKSLADNSSAPQCPVPSELLDDALQQVKAQFGAESEETTEKVQQAVEKLKGEFTSFTTGIEFLACKRIERQQVLFKALLHNKSLCELRLGSNGFGSPGEDGKSSYQSLNRLAKLIDANESIQVLDLSNNRSGPQGIGIIAKSMCKNVSIHSLDLSGNDLFVDAPEEEEDPEFEADDPVFGEMFQALDALSEMIKKNKFLRTLSLRQNRIKCEVDPDGDDEGVDSPLGKFLEPFKKYHRVQALDLGSNDLGAGGAKLVLLSLKLNRSISVLDLSSNHLGPKGLGFIATLLADSQHLEVLNLQKNDLAPRKGKKSQKDALTAALSFAAALKKNQSLVTLNLTGNELGPDMCDAILSTLATSQLNELFFDNNNLCGSGPGEWDGRALAHIVTAVRRENSPLATLSLSGNFIQAAGCKLFAAEDVGIKNVVQLDFSRNHIGDAGCDVLIQAFSLITPNQCVALATLNLSYNDITRLAPLVPFLRSGIAPSLSNLLLSNNSLGYAADGADFEHFIALVGGNHTSINTLDIGTCKLGEHHARSISYLCRCSTAPFEHFFVDGNPNIDLKHCNQILSALENNKSIRKFRISAPDGEHGGLMETISAVLNNNRCLIDLDCGLELSVQGEGNFDVIRKKLLLNALQQ